MSLNTARVCK